MSTRDGEDAWFKGDTEDYAAVVLDLGLPQMDGLSVLKRWRANDRDFPVLVLTAQRHMDRAGRRHRFRRRRLSCRSRSPWRSCWRGCAPSCAAGPVTPRRSSASATVTLDTRLMRVTRNGVPLQLSPQEYRLVSYLIHNAGRVVPQQELAEQLQAEHYERESNAVEVLVGRVRRKLGAGRHRDPSRLRLLDRRAKS